jgi:hypothetical protein
MSLMRPGGEFVSKITELYSWDYRDTCRTCPFNEGLVGTTIKCRIHGDIELKMTCPFQRPRRLIPEEPTIKSTYKE